MNPVPARSALRGLVALLLGAGLTACASSNMQDLHSYVKHVESRQHSRIEPLPEFQPFQTFVYQDQKLRSPFTPPSFSRPASLGGHSDNGIHPDFNRPPEPLEQYPLDSLRMVGTLARNGKDWALIQDSSGTIHMVRPGNHLGQNRGKIVQITEAKVKLVEIVPDGMGGWMKRNAALALSE
ncbi:MAG: pilus assembly protein PilP [Gammaproteobacteria bacterium]